VLKITVLGASGRMGRAVLRCIAESDDLEVAGAVTESTDPAMGCDAGEASGVDSLGVPLTDDRENGLHEADAAIDFTLPSATEANIRACVKAGAALVIGTTGLETQQLKAMETGAEEIPLVYGRNMSIGMNVFMDLVSQAALTLDEDYDVEIIEGELILADIEVLSNRMDRLKKQAKADKSAKAVLEFAEELLEFLADGNIKQIQMSTDNL